MRGFYTDIELDTLLNENYRTVLYSGHYLQLVLMSLKAGEEIGEEVHEENDQFFRVESGSGKCVIDGNEYPLKAGSVIIVPAGAKHNVINTSPDAELKMYTIYAPPHHEDGLVRKTKEEAELHGADFDGKTTE